MILSNYDYSLNEEQLKSLSASAMEGDPAAAEKVSDFFLYAKKRQKKQSVRWAIVGAENNSARMQFRLFKNVAGSRKIDDQRRALFWLKKSASNENENAIAIHEQCGSIDARMKDVDESPCFGPGSDH